MVERNERMQEGWTDEERRKKGLEKNLKRNREKTEGGEGREGGRENAEKR